MDEQGRIEATVSLIALSWILLPFSCPPAYKYAETQVKCEGVCACTFVYHHSSESGCRFLNPVSKNQTSAPK